MIYRAEIGQRIRRMQGLAVATLIAALALTAPASLEAARGGHLLYASHGSLMSVPAQGGAPRKLAQVPVETLDLAASRDGQRIALISNRKLRPNGGSVRSIYLFRPGHGLRRLQQFDSSTPIYIAISPDGRWIAFGRQSEIWLMRASRGGIHQVTESPSVAWDPAFTPDGQALVFDRAATAGLGRGPQLFRQALSGGPEVQLSDDEGRQPAVSSTGLLLYTRPGKGAIDSRLIVTPLDGSKRRTVDRYRPPFVDLSTTFSPDGRSISYLRVWQKDGSGGEHRYSIHTKTIDGSEHRKVIGRLRSSAPRARFGGPAPAGPVWVPW
jgi:Tol biopolymer transport system component